MAKRSRCHCSAAVVAGSLIRVALCVTGGSSLWAQPQTPAGTQAPAPDNLVAGQTITLDLKGVDILDVLKLLSKQSGLNFVAGHNVAGRVTIFAKEVDVWEAFERIVEANELAYERQGDLINVMTATDYEQLFGEKFNERRKKLVIPLKYAKANQMLIVLNQLKSSLGQVVVDETTNTVVIHEVPTRIDEMKKLVAQLDRPTQTRIYHLNYAEAEKLREKLQDFLTPGIGMMSFDPRTNKAVVTDLQDVLPKIDQIIHAFDEREGEVLIDSKLVKVELSNDESFGVDWQQVFAGVDTKTRTNFRVLSDIVDVASTATPGTGGALKYLSAPTGNTQVIVEALRKFGKVETVSNPRITVSNGQEAKILVGTKEAFVTVTTTIPTTGSVVSSPEVQFVDVGTKLFVTPFVKRDGHIQMKIRPEVSTAKIETFQSNRIPIVSTTEAETNVLVKSGTTLIIGGLIEKKVDHTQSQLPILGDIPVIGSVFRSRVESTKKSELVVFLTPQVISTNGERMTRFQTEQVVERIADPHEEEPIPKAYQAQLRQLLEQRLRERLKRLAAGSGTITVSLVLSANGQLVGRPQLSSPQGKMFTEIAQSALESMTFPPFPEGTKATEVQFRFAVDYKQQ